VTTPLVDVFKHRGRFFEILQQTENSQTAVMTFGLGQDAGPEETHRGDQIIYVIEGEAVVRAAGREHKTGAGALVMVRNSSFSIRHSIFPEDLSALLPATRRWPAKEGPYGRRGA
jgi:mannose-6-phosphate isomerase-like protein (cupin superfamily)